jgi:hypothetical protein
MSRSLPKRSTKTKTKSKAEAKSKTRAAMVSSPSSTKDANRPASKSTDKNRTRDRGAAKSAERLSQPGSSDRGVSKSAEKPSQPRSGKAAPSSGTPEKTKQLQNAAIPAKKLFDPADIIDAPEFHEEARAMGILTTGTWDEDRRSFEDRLADFLFAHPPSDPARNVGGRLQRQDDRSFAPGNEHTRLDRFLSETWSLGSIHEVLSRFGLKMKNAPPYEGHLVRLDPLRDVAKRRNVRLRVLHGGVDVEPADMDAAKAEFLDRQEKEQAARDIRLARQRMAVKRDDAP